MIFGCTASMLLLTACAPSLQMANAKNSTKPRVYLGVLDPCGHSMAQHGTAQRTKEQAGSVAHGRRHGPLSAVHRTVRQGPRLHAEAEKSFVTVTLSAESRMTRTPAWLLHATGHLLVLRPHIPTTLNTFQQRTLVGARSSDTYTKRNTAVPGDPPPAPAHLQPSEQQLPHSGHVLLVGG